MAAVMTLYQPRVPTSKEGIRVSDVHVYYQASYNFTCGSSRLEIANALAYPTCNLSTLPGRAERISTSGDMWQEPNTISCIPSWWQSGFPYPCQNSYLHLQCISASVCRPITKGSDKSSYEGGAKTVAYEAASYAYAKKIADDMGWQLWVLHT